MKRLKKSLLAVVAAVTVLTSTVYASFPVKEQNATQQTTTATINTSDNKSTEQFVKKAEAEKSINAAPTSGPNDDLIITLLLWFFLGFLAAHRWYKKKPIGWNILFILTVGGWGIWWIIDLVNILTGEF